MKISNFLYILAVTAVLSGYSAWVLAERQREAAIDGSGTHIPTKGIPLLRLAEARALWDQPSTLFLDVRSAPDYAYGHIAGAINVPEEELEQRLPELKPRLERARAIVIYCKSVDCGKSLWAALRLHQEGFSQVRIYPAGWNEWHEYELPSVRTSTR